MPWIQNQPSGGFVAPKSKAGMDSPSGGRRAAVAPHAKTGTTSPSERTGLVKPAAKQGTS